MRRTNSGIEQAFDSAVTVKVNKPAVQKYLPRNLRKWMESYRKWIGGETIVNKKIFKYIEKHQHEPEFLNALQSKKMNRGSILTWAVEHDQWNVAEAMLKCDGVNVNQVDLNNELPLAKCLSRCTDYRSDESRRRGVIFKLLAYPGVDVTKEGLSYYPGYPLVIALERELTEFAKIILSRGGHCNYALVKAVKIAVEKGYSDIVCLILESSNVSDVVFKEAMQSAMKTRYNAVQLLVDKGLCIWSADLLLWAAKNAQYRVLDKVLAHTEIDINFKDDSGDTALHHAAAVGFAAGIKMLLQHGADPNRTNKNGLTPLLAAVCRSDAGAASVLLASDKADLTIADSSGKTALMIAAENGMTSVVKMLLDRDSSCVNAQDNNGDTALILAARHHHDAIIVKELLTHGADVMIENSLSYTALMEAKKSGHKGLCPLLKNSYQHIQPIAVSEVTPSAPPLESEELVGLKAAAVIPPVSLNKSGLFATREDNAGKEQQIAEPRIRH
ncbi:MAG TPA: ankyrin repeat domain-containing protein [Gammaproteobacteria bacterium]|nr:ankyrin repeat domain-containing protein [Gammaproteobacteria bacterium]